MPATLENHHGAVVAGREEKLKALHYLKATFGHKLASALPDGMAATSSMAAAGAATGRKENFCNTPPQPIICDV